MAEEQSSDGVLVIFISRFEVNLRKQCEVARSQRKSDLLEGEAKRRAGRRVWLSQEVTHGRRKEVQIKPNKRRRRKQKMFRKNNKTKKADFVITHVAPIKHFASAKKNYNLQNFN